MISAALGLILAMPDTAAASRTDTVLLRNGDRLHGEVRGLFRGRLEFSTASMSTVYVQWEDVVEVAASDSFEVSLADGRRFVGRLAVSAPGRMGLVLEDGRVLSLEFLSVVRMDAIGSVWWKRLSGGVSLGASYTRSSGVGQGTLASNVEFRRPAFGLTASFDSTVSIDNDQISSSRTSFRSGYFRLLPNRWFLPGLLRIERNPDLGFDLRTIAGGGVGRFLWRSNRGVLGVGGGMVVDREHPVGGGAYSGVDGFVAVNGAFFRHTAPETDLSFTATAFPSLSDSGRLRFELNSALTHEFVNDFTLGLTIYTSYDNRPVYAGALTTDVGGSLTLGWSF